MSHRGTCCTNVHPYFRDLWNNQQNNLRILVDNGPLMSIPSISLIVGLV